MRHHEDAAAGTDHHVLLIGLPGAGKTSIGRQLAKLLQRPFADADEQLALTAGCTITRLVDAHGHDDLRNRERQTLTDLLRRDAPLVISAPGAIEIDRDIRELVLRSAVVLWIRGSLPLLVDLADPAHRPRLAGGHRESLTRLDAELAPHYRQISDHIVDIDPFYTRARTTVNEEPKHAIARHIVDILATGALASSIGIPDDALTPSAPDVRAVAESATALFRLYDHVANHTVDIERFNTQDDPLQAIVDHIIDLLAGDTRQAPGADSDPTGPP